MFGGSKIIGAGITDREGALRLSPWAVDIVPNAVEKVWSMSKWQTGPKNGMWKGGRVIDPRGYVLIRVGKDHPLADCRGYAYEHRLKVAAKPGEIVHHDNERKGDNAESNLIKTTRVLHRVHHRKPNSKMRKPG